MSDSTTDFFEFLAKVLLRCSLLGFVLLLIWLAAILLKGEPIHRWHGPFFNISPDQLSVIHYCGIGLLDMLLVVFFVIPYLALKLALRKPSA